MFKSISFLLVLLAAGSICSAQDSLPMPKKRIEQTIEFNALGYVNSNTIHNYFIRSFYYGRYLDDNIKFTASRRLKESNLLGGMTRTGFTYTFRSLEKNNAPLFSFSVLDRTHLDLKFSDDMFNVVFYGNKQYAGQTAGLGDFALNFLRYQQFRFGWSKKGDAHHGSYGVAFSLLSGEQNVLMNMPRADLYTAPDGTYLDFDVAFDIHRSDTSNKGYFAQNGMGLSADLFYEMPYTTFSKPGNIRVEIKDLGFIRWNSKSQHYSAGSAYHYEGVAVDDLFDLDSNSLGVDNIIDENTNLKYRKYITDIPGALDIRTKTFYGKQLAFEKGITWRFHTSAKMYYFGKIHFLMGRRKTIDIAYVIGYGGYGLFNSGLDVSADIGKNYSFQFMNYYLFSDVTAQSTTGMGMFVKLLRKF